MSSLVAGAALVLACGPQVDLDDDGGTGGGSTTGLATTDLGTTGITDDGVDGSGGSTRGTGPTLWTEDLDIAMAFTQEQVSRLLDALRPFAPRHATRPDLGVIADPIPYLMTFPMLLVETSIGRIDILREVPPLGGHADPATTSWISPLVACALGGYGEGVEKYRSM